MAVEVVYRSSRDPERLFMDKAEADRYDKMLEQYAPPGILVDEHLQPLQLFGNLTDYLATPNGRPFFS